MDEPWATWVPVADLSRLASEDELYSLARVRLSNGKVFKSRQNRRIPAIGSIPGGDTVILSTVGDSTSSVATAMMKMSTERVIELLQAQIAELIEELPHNDTGVYEWETITQRLLEEGFGRGHRNVNHFVATTTYSGLSEVEYQEQYTEWVRDKKGMVKAFIRELQLFQSTKAAYPEIVSARWGTGSDYRDKTDLLRGYLESETQDLRASDHHFHDDYPGQPKHLLVQYRWPGSTELKTRVFAHNDSISFG